MTNSVCDEHFLNVGNKDGIIIWRIEDFKLTSLNPSEYGKLNFFLDSLLSYRRPFLKLKSEDVSWEKSYCY
jgi:hypothetical protein